MLTGTTQNVNKQVWTCETAWRQTGCGTFDSPGRPDEHVHGDELPGIPPRGYKNARPWRGIPSIYPEGANNVYVYAPRQSTSETWQLTTNLVFIFPA